MAADVVLVHGGWHRSTCWERVADALSSLGFEADAVQLPFRGLSTDIDAVRSAIKAAGPSSVAVAHSYGGAVLSEAAAGAADVSHLIYVAAFLLEPTEWPEDFLSPELTAALRIEGEELTVDGAQAATIFYGEQDSDTTQAAVSQLRGMRIDRDDVVRGVPAWKTRPATYVVCSKDRAIPAEAQRMMAARARQTIELGSDHSPFLSHPRTIAGLIADRVVAARRP